MSLPTKQQPRAEEIGEILAEIEKRVPAPLRFLVRKAIPLIDAVSARMIVHELNRLGKDGLQLLFEGEAKTLVEAQKELYSLWTKADAIGRVDLNFKLERVSGELRRLERQTKGFAYLKSLPPPELNNDTDNSDSQAWFNRFDEMARRENEPWRNEIIERAFAHELAKPGSIGIDGILSVGIISKSAFESFGYMLDLFCCLGENQIGIPLLSRRDFYTQHLCIEDGSKKRLGELLLDASANLLVPDGNGGMNLGTQGPVVAQYGGKKVRLSFHTELIESAIIPTPLGLKLSILHHRTFRQLGSETFDKWLEEIKPLTSSFEVIATTNAE
jgi:hypothetical protein